MQYPVIGIDLGTCFSCVYGFRNGMFTLVPGDCGNTTPSVIQYGPKGPVFGQMAKKSIRSNPTNTIYDVKRFLGLPYEQCQSIIEHEHYGFKCIPYNRSLVYEIQYNNQSCFTTPEHVDADFLKYLVKRAEEHLEYKVEGAVITIPAFFQYSQTDATLRAAKEAGLNIYCIVYEPNAAAIAINPIPGVDERHFLVFDLGGGTFDVALIQAKLHDYRIIGNGGHPFLGGRDFDQVVVNLIEEALKPYCDISTWRPSKMARLRTYAEEVKIELSQTKAVELDLSDFDVDLDAPVYITRKQFENGIKGYVDLAIQICDATLQSTGISLGRNDCILLVGGSSKIPAGARGAEEEVRRHHRDEQQPRRGRGQGRLHGGAAQVLHDARPAAAQPAGADGAAHLGDARGGRRLRERADPDGAARGRRVQQGERAAPPLVHPEHEDQHLLQGRAQLGHQEHGVAVRGELPCARVHGEGVHHTDAERDGPSALHHRHRGPGKEGGEHAGDREGEFGSDHGVQQAPIHGAGGRQAVGE